MKRKRLIISVLLITIISLIGFYLHLNGFRIIENPQKDYAKFMIAQNDKMIGHMIEFEKISDKELEDDISKEELDRLKVLIVEEQKVILFLQKYKPDDSNKDYVDIHSDMLESYAYYMQTQISKYDTFSKPSEERRKDTFILNNGMNNLLAENIIFMHNYINEIRETNHASIYTFEETEKQTNN